jgi:hypothetical protein
MRRVSFTTLPLLIVLAGILISCSRQLAPSTAQPAAEPEPAAEAATQNSATAPETPESLAHTEAVHTHDGEAHQDHNSKHGGTFFMALNNKNHLEGVLDPPGVFRVYLYDDHTRPVSPEVLNQAQMMVIWGEQDGAPEIDLKPSQDASMLEANAPGTMHFPVTLTLLVHFPGAAATDRPELFTFPFSHYSHPPAAETHAHPGGR